MSSPAFPLSANQARQEVQQFQRNFNPQRRIEAFPEQLAEVSAQTTVHVYNVGPWEHRRELGTAGTFLIPACSPGERYSRLRPIPGIPIDYKIIDEATMGILLEPKGGRYLAEQVVGAGSHMHPGASLLHKGVFIGAQVGPNAKPTDGEIGDANRLLESYYEDLVVEARRAFEQGPKAAEETIRDQHHLAARALNLDPKVEQWMGRKTAVSRASCEGCGTPVDGNPILCPVCKYVLDEERYEANKKRFAK